MNIIDFGMRLVGLVLGNVVGLSLCLVIVMYLVVLMNVVYCLLVIW